MRSSFPIALSFCPNDTFLFYGWIEGKVGSEMPCVPYFADIEKLNCLAEEDRFPLIKLSLHHYPNLSSRYSLLTTGITMGFGMGPKIIGKKKISLDHVQQLRVALPGQRTTAHFLFDHFFPHVKEKKFVLYHEIEDVIDREEVDCGVIIHESRFTFESKGYFEIADLGELWEKKYQLPLPLGGLALRRDFQTEKVESILKDSLQYAHNNCNEALSFALRFSREKESAVIKKHVDLYLNDESKELSERGRRAINLFFSLVKKDETSFLCDPSRS